MQLALVQSSDPCKACASHCAPFHPAHLRSHTDSFRARYAGKAAKFATMFGGGMVGMVRTQPSAFAYALFLMPWARGAACLSTLKRMMALHVLQSSHHTCCGHAGTMYMRSASLIPGKIFVRRVYKLTLRGVKRFGIVVNLLPCVAFAGPGRCCIAILF